MENDSTNLPVVFSPGSPTATTGDMMASHHRRQYSLPSLQTVPENLGSGYMLPPSPLGHTAGNVAGGGAGNNSSSRGHARSFSQPAYMSTLYNGLEAFPSPPPPQSFVDGHQVSSPGFSLTWEPEIQEGYLTGEEELHGFLNGGHLLPEDSSAAAVPAPGGLNAGALPAEDGNLVVADMEQNFNTGNLEALLSSPLPGESNGGSVPRTRAEAVQVLYDYAKGKFSQAVMKKIMANERLVQLMRTDPTRVKRILCNRVSSAKMLARKEEHRLELERKLSTMEKQASAFSEQLRSLKRASAQLRNENNELKIKLRSAERIDNMKEVLNEILFSELKHLHKLANTHEPSGSNQQMNAQVIQTQLLQMQEVPSQPQPTQPEQFDTQQPW